MKSGSSRKKHRQPLGIRWLRSLTIGFDRLVVVEWVDSHITTGWTSENQDDEPQSCLSVGWIVAENERALSVSPHISIEDKPQRNGTMTIPKVSIIRIGEIIVLLFLLLSVGGL